MARKRLKTEARRDWKTRIFDCLSVPALVLKPTRIIVDVNACFLEKFGGDREYVVGKTCHDLFYRSVAPCPAETCPFAKVLADRHGHSVLEHMTTEAGIERWDNRVFSAILQSTRKRHWSGAKHRLRDTQGKWGSYLGQGNEQEGDNVRGGTSP